MLARYLKAQLFVLICGGIVGPIFIACYFLLPSMIGSQFSGNGIDTGSLGSLVQDNIGWMLYVGALITIADVVVALWLANRGARSSAKSAALRQTGVLTVAQIIGLAETGMRVNERPVVRLNLRIAGPGFEFDSNKRVIVDITKQAVVTSGKVVVLVDPNTREYEIDWQASGLIAGVVPAQFTSTEDNKTYDLRGQPDLLMEILQIYKANNLPFGGTTDLRNYPAVRQQVMAVVRRAQHAQAVPAPAGAFASEPGGPAMPPPPQAPASQRLQELETLRATGAITEAEYTAKREKIISEL
ncbi:hypothetical protein A5791_09665 [Mycobacterium sp. 852002-51163_SCH5372311]|uniref:SHOCT domain-containing protein n=1 Tax=Mycobacterium sp. 852002-51163_SCH5372311 TaxID=1834097 RepID=UPI0007FEBE1A|nr:SHOCT domain-containing protein [Mycobacterium sp. 852002-51163_SCH5372311]OBF79939.1 hypothetical protein A5791_09665 [Mycobacterium sp. 852002-51163_SCH5372311]